MIPSLVLIEIWQWTPLVMLIVLGGLASLPTEPYKSALIDGASQWQMFRHITWPLVLPFVMVAVVIRAIDAIKAFDTIFVITQGGPGTASETINIFLYLQAFALLQHRLRLGRRRGLLRHHHCPDPGPAVGPPAHAMDART